MAAVWCPMPPATAHHVVLHKWQHAVCAQGLSIMLQPAPIWCMLSPQQPSPPSCSWWARPLCQVHIPIRGEQPHIIMRAHLPPSYPSRSAPLLEVEAPHLEPRQLEQTVAQLEDSFRTGGTHAAAMSSQLHGPAVRKLCRTISRY